MRHHDGASGFEVLREPSSVYMWGVSYATRTGKAIPHTVGYNADTRLLMLGCCTLLLQDDDLHDVQVGPSPRSLAPSHPSPHTSYA